MTRREKGRELLAKAEKMYEQANKIITEGNKLRAKAINIWEQGYRLENGQRQHKKFNR